MIYLLLLTLIIILILSYYINGKDIIAPSFIFALSFTFSSIWAVAYADIWNLDSFHKNTYFVITGGVLLFVIVSLLVKVIFSIKKQQKNIEIHEIKIDLLVKIICIIFELITIYLCLTTLLNVVGGSWGNIFESINKYDQISKFSDEFIGIGRLPSLFQIATNALSYWYVYVVINNYIVNKKIDFVGCIIILLGMIASMTTGGRNAAINMMLSIPAITVILARKKSNYKKLKINFKTKFLIIVIPIIVLISFPRLTALVGREVKQDNMYYLAIYCGAEIKNLDIYIQDNINNNLIIKHRNQSFRHLINWIGPKLGDFEPYKLYLPFRKVNGYGLGNVYTTFYFYIMDYGYIGVVWCVSLMALISQFIYEKCRRVKLSATPKISILMYGYIFSSLVLSFFSNKFYEQNFNKTFIYAIILWNVFNIIFPKIKLKSDKRKELK